MQEKGAPAGSPKLSAVSVALKQEEGGREFPDARRESPSLCWGIHSAVLSEAEVGLPGASPDPLPGPRAQAGRSSGPAAATPQMVMGGRGQTVEGEPHPPALENTVRR